MKQTLTISIDEALVQKIRDRTRESSFRNKSHLVEEAVKKFDGSFVAYILISIGAYNLHPPMFGSDTPKIEFYIWDEKYNAEIIDGKINVQKGEIAERDIIIWTSAEEAVKMVKDKNYISESFKTGASKVELVAGKIELAAKGYISIYDKLTG